MQAPAPTRPDTLPRLSIARKPQPRFLTLTHARRDSGEKAYARIQRHEILSFALSCNEGFLGEC